MSAVVGDEDSSCLEDSCADVLSLDEDPAIEMLEDDEDVDKPYLPLPPVPFVVTFVPALPLLPLLVPVLLYADDETDLQTFVRCEYREHQFHSAGPAAKGYPLPSLNPPLLSAALLLSFQVMQRLRAYTQPACIINTRTRKTRVTS